ncbi:hypothetical protein K432DRAFT_171114 [Lepidopterella palustris CBS 459.81]|uniref:Uncharacterized protein n=1 Tax=Lepidopterella palustris CBS 459.81 TaxID=1314670 RepID=A0A8E2E167_9PEZI|nr:hypothetical protein K432DRAFT_171114 [Lepidopterella palustris CBS 459.81]
MSADLAHWSLYGQPGTQPARRVTATDWQVEPFLPSQIGSAPWNVPLFPDQIKPLIAGFCPEAMEDKWFIYSEGPDAEGKLQLHFHRSWTGHKIFLLDIDLKREGSEHVVGITWNCSIEQTGGTDEVDAKEIVGEVCRWVLGVKLQESVAA